MPSSWIKGLVTWLSGLALAVLMLAAVAETSARPAAVGSFDSSSLELHLPGLSGAPSVTERTV